MVVENGKTKVNYGTLFSKLLKDQVNPKCGKWTQKTKGWKYIQPTKVQRKLLDVYRFKDFKTSPTFKFVSKVNEFVIEYADKKTTFLQKHPMHFPTQVNLKLFYELLVKYMWWIMENWCNELLQTMHTTCRILCRIFESYIWGFWNWLIWGYWRHYHQLEGEKNVKISGHKRHCTISNV
jgi:hypothetical protein